MRTITTAERAAIAAEHHTVYLRVEVLAADGVTWQDLTALGTPAVDWVDSVTWSESIDQPVMSGTLTLRRTAGGQTIAPLMAANAINRTGGSYAPVLDVGRALRVWGAVTLPGTAPVSTDWILVVDGRLDDYDLASVTATADAGTIGLPFRDLGADALDAQLENPRVYGSAAGTDAELVIQQILDDGMGPASPTVVTPVSPAFAVTPYQPNAGATLEAARAVALQIGWDLRRGWASRTASALYFRAVQRTKSVPDWTLGPTEYSGVTAFSVSRTDVRNVVQVLYRETPDGPVRTVTRTDAGSVAAYGRRFMRLAEAASTNIDTAVEATALADAALSDLATPPVTQSVTALALWFIELGDLGAFPANDVHYDDAQTFGVVGIEHSMSGGTWTTTVQTRGTVAGAYREWLRRAGGAGDGLAPSDDPTPRVGTLYGESSAFGGSTGDGGVWLELQFERGTTEIRVHQEIGPTSPVVVPDLNNNTLGAILTRGDGDTAGADDFATLHFIAAVASYYRKLRVFGRNEAGSGATVIREVQAVDTIAPTLNGYSAFTVTRTGTTNALAWTAVAGSSSPQPIEHLVIRDGLVIKRLPASATSWSDTGVNPSTPYTYDLCQWTAGVSGAKYAANAPATTGGGTGPTAAGTYPAPVFTGGTPVLDGDRTSVDVSWTCSDSSATAVVVEFSSIAPGAAWEERGRGAVASDTYIDLTYWTRGYYRLRTVGAGDVTRATSATALYPGLVFRRPATGDGTLAPL